MDCGRFSIYRCKYSESKSVMLQFFNLINFVKKYEFIIAKQNNKLPLHYKKFRWCSDLSIFSLANVARARIAFCDGYD